MSEQQRFHHEIDDLQQWWDRLRAHLARLQQQMDLETRVEEQLRIQNRIEQTQAERAGVEAQLRACETALQKADRITEARRLERNQAYPQAIHAWEDVRALDPDDSLSAQEIQRLQALQQRAQRLNERIQQLARRMLDIKPIFAQLVLRVKQMLEGGGEDVTMLSLVDSFLAGELSAAELTTMVQTLDGPNVPRPTPAINFRALAARHQATLDTRIKELQTRWERLSQILQALQQQRDLETRADECLRLDALIAQREGERQQVAAQLHDVEQELHTSRSTDVASPSLPAPPEALSPAPPTRPVTIFYSYSHKDEALRDQLEKHLAILQRQHVISGWHDRAIQAGVEWELQIHEHLESADIILLLVSADFLASDYCWGKEVTRAMERHELGTARVIPILLRAVDWTGAPFSKLQALPKDAKPVMSWSNHDEAFADIARGIRQVATALSVEKVEKGVRIPWMLQGRLASRGGQPTALARLAVCGAKIERHTEGSIQGQRQHRE